MLKNQKLYSLKQEVMDTLINELKTNRIKADNIGQTILSQKLDFLIDVTEKEKVLFEKGFTEFIWHKDLTRYITSVTPNAQPSGARGLFIKNTITKFDITVNFKEKINRFSLTRKQCGLNI